MRRTNSRMNQDGDTRRGRQRKKIIVRKKICRFCVDASQKIDYKDSTTLRPFVTERAKIIPARISGNCCKHQRQVKRAIKQARNLSILPYTVSKI